jgi:CspA family cold shock protein
MLGSVKWFNNKAGYGFITMKENDIEKDIFTHYSTVKVGDTQYKYLVQGEYVEFDLAPSTNTQHEFQAINVTGIQGGKLMCETRQINLSTRRPVAYESDNDEYKQVTRNRKSKPVVREERPKTQKKA